MPIVPFELGLYAKHFRLYLFDIVKQCSSPGASRGQSARQWPDPSGRVVSKLSRVGSGGVTWGQECFQLTGWVEIDSNLTGRVGSGQEMMESARVGSGHDPLETCHSRVGAA